jgi:hypothetical protein
MQHAASSRRDASQNRDRTIHRRSRRSRLCGAPLKKRCTASGTRKTANMPQPPSAYELHQRKRWLRHDMHLWIRHDAARWVKPGTDPADVFPTLARDRARAQAAKESAGAAEDAAFDALIEGQRRVLAAIREAVDELNAATGAAAAGGELPRKQGADRI